MTLAASADARQSAAFVTMQVLLKAYTDILLRRQGPDALPASSFMLQLALAGYVAVSIAGLLIDGVLFSQPLLSLAAVLFDAALLCAWIWILLGVAGQPQRLPQSLSAALGCGAIIGLYTLPVLMLLVMWEPAPTAGAAATEITAEPSLPVLARFAVAIYVVLLAWFAAVLGHILTRAMQIHSLAGLALGIFYVLASLTIVSALFPLGG